MENPYAIDGMIYIEENITNNITNNIKNNKRKQEIFNTKTNTKSNGNKRTIDNIKINNITSNILTVYNKYKKPKNELLDNLDFFDQMVIY